MDKIYIVTAGEGVYNYTLPFVPASGEEINIYVNGVRIDDINFNTPLQTNIHAVMQTWIGNGVDDIIILPNLTSIPPLDINEGDKVIFRRSTSDGSFAPQANEYDTQLQGGAFNGSVLTTATGYAPDYIIVDGDDFVSPTTSYSPEEVLPGHVTDALAIKVFHRPAGGSPNILFKNYVGDSITDTFIVGQYFASERAVIIKIGNVISEQSTYTIDWPNNSVIFNVAPAAGEVVSIISVGFNSESILDLDHFIADGSTLEYITRAPWINGGLASIVLVNGAVVGYELFQTDSTYHSPNRVGIRFSEIIPTDSIINYIIDTDTSVQTSSIVKSQTITIYVSTVN